MPRTALLLSILVAATLPAIAEDAPPQQPTVQVKGKALVLSCSEWRRNADGTWTSTGPLLVGTETVNSVTLRGRETGALEAKCNGGGVASPAPAEEAKPKKGKHAPAAPPAQGT